MKKWIVFPVISTSMLFACSDPPRKQSQQNQVQSNTYDHIQANVAWVGHYQGVTPCETCVTRCDGCDGTAVDLILKPDMQYELTVERLSESNAAKVFTGRAYFTSDTQNHIELTNIKKRHGLIYDFENDQFEILNDSTAQSYESAQEFILEKIV